MTETLDASVQEVAGSFGSPINYAAFVANSAKAGVQRLNAANICNEAIGWHIACSGAHRVGISSLGS